MNKPPKALLDAIDQMEQLPGIAGVFSEVRLQIFHREAMRKEDWAYITSSGWLYVHPQRQARRQNGSTFSRIAACIWRWGISEKKNREMFCGSAPATA